MGFPFNRDQITMMIQEYRKYPELYDRSNPQYSDTSRRYDCWIEITQKLIQTCNINPTIEDVKLKIKTLRTQLAHETDKEKKMRRRGKPYRSTWYYYKYLIFLVKGGFVERRGSKHSQFLSSTEDCTSENANESNNIEFQDENSGISFYDPLEIDLKPDVHSKIEVHNVMNDSSTTSSYRDNRFQFQREHIEVLIELYKSYPELYNPRHSSYYDRERKLNCWEDITEKLSTTFNISPSTEDIKHKVHSLRTQYAHALKMALKREGVGKKRLGPNGEDKKSYWWCFNLLTFLSQIERKKASRINHSDFSTILEQNGTMDEIGSHDMLLEESQGDDVLDINDVDCSYSASLEETSDEDCESVSTTQKSQSKAQKTDSPEDDITAFAQYIETELRKIKDKKKVTRLKRDIVNMVYDTIEADIDTLETNALEPNEDNLETNGERSK
ncbi:unnamed protein product [Acanthoscelides obtectus]|uniref:MADF domain-containing protein n=1 Tax=Acanthoscelides obtectus TaxID=200917 RepID=A0A9P0JTP3_ACAOB|nr:unnamed protein product [Acanthoscelides obtectus]CAK1633883.1 hypothetical protein AOBTE_LOCUS8458 [Acanthoscelides obtectus]